MFPLEAQAFVDSYGVPKGLSSSTNNFLSLRKRRKENINQQHALENKKIKTCFSGLSSLGQEHLIGVQLSKRQKITVSESSCESSSHLTNSGNQLKKKVKSKKGIWDTKGKKKKAFDAKALFEKMITNKGTEIDKAIKEALRKIGPVSTDVEPCKVPNIGNGLRATKVIAEGTPICGIMNGILPPLVVDNAEPISHSYTFDFKILVDKKKRVLQLDGNTSTINDPVKNREKLLAHCQGGLGKDTSLLQLINYSPPDTANVSFYSFTFKCQRVSFEMLGVSALRDIAAGEELRMDYGDVYFNLSSYYFFEKFRENLDNKKITRDEVWDLFKIADQYCCDAKGKIIHLDKASQKKIIESLDGKSQTLLTIWEKKFFKTLEDLFNRKAEYSQATPAAESAETSVENSTDSEQSKLSQFSEFLNAVENSTFPKLPDSSKSHSSTVEASETQETENSSLEECEKNFEDSEDVKRQRSLKQQKINFRTIIHLKTLQDFNEVYKKIKSTPMSEDQIIDRIKDLNLKSLEPTIRIMIAFLFSDLNQPVKQIILRHLLENLKLKVQKPSEAKKMAKANPDMCFFKNASFLQLVAWMSKDAVFVKAIIDLHLQYCPKAFAYKPDGNTAADCANYYGNTLTEKLLKGAEVRLGVNKEEGKNH